VIVLVLWGLAIGRKSASPSLRAPVHVRAGASLISVALVTSRSPRVRGRGFDWIGIDRSASAGLPVATNASVIALIIAGTSYAATPPGMTTRCHEEHCKATALRPSAEMRNPVPGVFSSRSM
jgi:hypothetical protein